MHQNSYALHLNACQHSPDRKLFVLPDPNTVKLIINGEKLCDDHGQDVVLDRQLLTSVPDTMIFRLFDSTGRGWSPRPLRDGYELLDHVPGGAQTFRQVVGYLRDPTSTTRISLQCPSGDEVAALHLVDYLGLQTHLKLEAHVEEHVQLSPADSVTKYCELLSEVLLAGMRSFSLPSL